MRLIDNLLGTKGSAERTPFERAQYVVSMVFRILDWKDRMRRADPSAARLNKDNIVRLKLFFYRECLRFEPMGGVRLLDCCFGAYRLRGPDAEASNTFGV